MFWLKIAVSVSMKNAADGPTSSQKYLLLMATNVAENRLKVTTYPSESTVTVSFFFALKPAVLQADIP